MVEVVRGIRQGAGKRRNLEFGWLGVCFGRGGGGHGGHVMTGCLICETG